MGKQAIPTKPCPNPNCNGGTDTNSPTNTCLTCSGTGRVLDD